MYQIHFEELLVQSASTLPQLQSCQEMSFVSAVSLPLAT